jgi:3-oxoacyl-[acyl-carrier-protein] synthase II
MTRNRVVITGVGVLAPNGIGKESFWKALVEGRSGISRIDSFDVSHLPTQIAGQIKGFDPTAYIQRAEARRMARQTQLSVSAAKMASMDAGLELGGDFRGRSCIIGTSNPALDLYEEEITGLIATRRKPHATRYGLTDMDPFCVSGAVAKSLAFSDVARTICNSCTSGANSIGLALREIQNGRVHTALAGSADCAIFPLTFVTFCAAGIMSTRNAEPETASRPFDRDRDGGVLAEGAAVFVLEELDRALLRNATIYAELIGYGECALSSTPPAFTDSLAQAMSLALRDAQLAPQDIDYISAHAPSDPFSDIFEVEAIKKVFGKTAYRIPTSSIKSMIGNPQSAAAPLQFASALHVLDTGIIPPTINYSNPDPRCDLDVVPNTPRKNKVDIIMINSHGINGTDAALIVSRYP